MELLQAPDHWLSRFLFERGLAGIFLVAFLVARDQFRPLLGEHGLLPVPRFVRLVPFRRSPSLFHWRYSDRLLAAVAWTGIVGSALLVVGLPQRGPAWMPMLAWLACWALYLSIVNVGQTFYAFGWESLLLDAGFAAVFLGPSWAAPPAAMPWLLRWLLFRLEFGAGLIKIRGDPCWRDLTCLLYHHETQPMPNPLSWYFHRLPPWVHRLEVAGNHVLQLVVPFGLFAPQPVAGLAGLAILVHQSWLIVSGNFSWLNWMAVVLAVWAFTDGQVAGVLPLGGLEPATLAPAPAWFHGAALAYALAVVVLSWFPVRNMLSRRQLMNYSFNPLHLVNTYGAFGSITRERYEIAIEGCDDPRPGPSTEWREYGFRGKPGDPWRRPPQVAPYHLRLDWLMWFAAMAPPLAHPWVVVLCERLLEGDRATLKLLRRNPFPDGPPRFVRAVLYRYRFTTWAERRGTGAWWVRTYAGEYLPPLRLAPTMGAWRR